MLTIEFSVTIHSLCLLIINITNWIPARPSGQ